jgi:hypothetical protein
MFDGNALARRTQEVIATIRSHAWKRVCQKMMGRLPGTRRRRLRDSASMAGRGQSCISRCPRHVHFASDHDRNADIAALRIWVNRYRVAMSALRPFIPQFQTLCCVAANVEMAAADTGDADEVFGERALFSVCAFLQPLQLVASLCM